MAGNGIINAECLHLQGLDKDTVYNEVLLSLASQFLGEE